MIGVSQVPKCTSVQHIFSLESNLKLLGNPWRNLVGFPNKFQKYSEQLYDKNQLLPSFSA